jgi:hypothetical protein
MEALHVGQFDGENAFRAPAGLKSAKRSIIRVLQVVQVMAIWSNSAIDNWSTLRIG